MELLNSPPPSDPLQFWEQLMHVYPPVVPLAQDLISAPLCWSHLFSLWPFDWRPQ